MSLSASESWSSPGSLPRTLADHRRHSVARGAGPRDVAARTVAQAGAAPRDVAARAVAARAVAARDVPAQVVAQGGVAARPRPTGRGRIVLTRRGRLVVSGLVGAIVLASLALLGISAAGAAAAAGSGPPPGAVYRGMARVVVRPGDTLWAIALRAQSTADPRIVVQQIIDVNALSGTAIQPGQRLWVPRG